MTEEILKRIQEIDKELEKIKKEEELEMKENLNEKIHNETMKFIKNVDDADFELFNVYVEATNKHYFEIDNMFFTGAYAHALYFIERIVKVYVWKIYNKGNVSLSVRERNNLVDMYKRVCEYMSDNIFLQSYIYGLLDGVVEKKGGE